MGRQLALNKKVGSWGYPGLKDWSRRGSNFEFDAIHIICAHAKPEDKLLLRVLVPKSHTSLHCVAVWNGRVADPDVEEGVWYPLTPDSFERKLGIGEVVAGYKLREF